MADKKYDLKNELKNIYKVKRMDIVDVPALSYIAIAGEGNPNGEEFSSKVEALYKVAYAISMSYRNDFQIQGFYPFVVPPLEGYWDTIDGDYDGNKENLKYQIMIAMPDFVNALVVSRAKEIAIEKSGNKRVEDVCYLSNEPYQACLALHLGSYDNEPETFSLMEDYVRGKGLSRVEKSHREIYISDPRKVESDKLKTVLVFQVK